MINRKLKMDDKENARSWLVLAVVTFCFFLDVAIIKGFSVLLPELKEQLETDTWIVGSCISIISGLGSVLGVSAGFVVRVCSPRVCVMICGSLAAIGLVVCSCSVSPLTLLLGLILIGSLLLQENVVVGVIPQYFGKYYETAVGIYSCGTALGLLVMPIITQFLLDTYGWRGTLILISGLALQSVPCGALLEQKTTKKTEKNEKLPLLISGNDDTTGKVSQKSSPIKWMKAACKIVGVPLLTRPQFIAQVLIPGFVWGYTLTGWTIYIVSFAVSIHATIKEASIVSTCGGIGMILVRLALPLIHRMMSHNQIRYVSAFIQAISLSLTTLFVSVIAMSVISTAFGVGMGILGAELYIAAKINSEEWNYTNAIAWLHLAYGFASILSGFLTGLLFDVTGSFTLSFNVLAVISMLTVLSLGLENILAAKGDSRR